MHRRQFLKTALVGAVAAAPVARLAAATEAAATPSARKLPRWRGFNLLEKFQVATQAPYVESDFQWMADWGFDFVRLPLDYRCWTDPKSPDKFDERVLDQIDEAVEFGRKHGVHICLNLHRAPGYTVAQPPEKRSLWTDEEAQRQFDFQWSHFARRYRDVASSRLSFNLLNEPANTSKEAYCRVVRRVVAAIRREDPRRLILADGLQWGRDPMFDLVDLGIAQSTRGYDPMPLTHYKASWVDSSRWPKPTWPLKEGDKLFDRRWLLHDRIEPWRKLAAKGVGVHVGEWGAFNKTPHDVALAWQRDCLDLWKDAGWGWALWNFRGAFGILDSQRDDVPYEDFHGHKLDRKMLDLLRKN